jgi:phosphate-selective porin OprO/OprP
MPDFGQGKTVVQDRLRQCPLQPGARSSSSASSKAPDRLERLQSANDMRWVQRGFPTSLVTNRDIGLMVQGDLGGGRFSYQAAYPQRLERR